MRHGTILSSSPLHGEKQCATSTKRSRIAEQEVAEFEHYVHLTSKLIGRPYIQTAKLMEKWPLEKIIRRYEECTKHAGAPPEGKTEEQWRAMLWWSKRKRELEESV